MKIAVIVENSSWYGRQIIDGVAAYAQAESDWSLALLPLALSIISRKPPRSFGKGRVREEEDETPANGGKPSAYPPSDSESRSDALAGVQFVAKRA